MNFNSILLGLITNNGNIPQMMIDPSTGGQMTIDGSGIYRYYISSSNFKNV